MHDLDAAAAALRHAYSGAALPPLREWLEPGDLASAYAVQEANERVWLTAGRCPVGYKIGLTAPAAQAFMGASEPTYGVLWADTRVPTGTALAAGRAKAARVEGEIALVLGQPITDPAAGDALVAASVAEVRAAIEICDSRIADWHITLADTVADNGSAGFFVLSEAGVAPGDIDLAACDMVMRVDGAIATQGTGIAASGDPLANLGWLARKLAAKGRPLQAGAVILSGSLGAIVPVAPGAQVEVTIGGLGTCGFTLAR